MGTRLTIKKPSPVDGEGLVCVTLLRFERRTYCLEGSCSIQLSYGAFSNLVGIARLERATSCSQSMHTNQLYYIPMFCF